MGEKIRLSGSGERVYKIMEQIKNLSGEEKNLLVKCIDASTKNDLNEVIRLLKSSSR